LNRKNLVKNVIKYILSLNTEQLSELTVGKISEDFDVNVCFLSRKFKEKTNILLSEYIDFVKMSQAFQLLKNRNDMGIEEIGQLIGIRKKQNFHEKFKKIYRLSPFDIRTLNDKRN
jgi:two-component system response regulator YesN